MITSAAILAALFIGFVFVMIFLKHRAEKREAKRRRWPSAMIIHPDNEARLTGDHERKLMRLNETRIVEMDCAEDAIS